MPTIIQHSSDVFSVPAFASPWECERWMLDAEQEGFESAPVTTSKGPIAMPDVRNNARVMRDAPEVAVTLWEGLEPTLPSAWRTRTWRGLTWRACGLNERLRFYRYGPGERFALHRDGSFVRSDEERSFLTVLIFLNEGFQGGETRILEPGHVKTITPEQGSVLCFAHRLLHEGATLVEGVKYVLRTDVMYCLE